MEGRKWDEDRREKIEHRQKKREDRVRDGRQVEE